VLVNILRSQESIPSLVGRYDSPISYLTYRPARRNQNLGIDSFAPLTFTNSGSGQKTYHVIEELPEGAPVLLLLEPEGVEVEAERSPICIVMSSLMRKKFNV
jgi:hypothetical protein